MRVSGRIWGYLVYEPFIYLFFYIFQPNFFQKELEPPRVFKRALRMFRLCIPIFLISLVAIFLIRSLFLNISFIHQVYGAGIETIPKSSFMNNSITFLLTIVKASFLGIIWGVVIGIIGDISLGISLSLGLSIALGVSVNLNSSLARGMLIAILLAMPLGTARSIAWKDMWGMSGNILSGVAMGIVAGIGWSFAGSINGGIVVTLAFILSYILGHFRLPLYIVSAISGLQTYLFSQRNSNQTFSYVKKSALYWDEIVYLPILGLKRTLKLSLNYEQDIQDTIEFIVKERPTQKYIAWAVQLEIIMNYLDSQETLQEIAQVSRKLERLLSVQPSFIDPQWIKPLRYLDDASRNAMRYCSLVGLRGGRSAKLDALDNMIKNLKREVSFMSFERDKQESLKKLFSNWQNIAQKELEQQKKIKEIGQIDNPYRPSIMIIPGPDDDSPFVGREDLARQLERALSKEHARQTFLLYGERRMGKSSTLKKLPDLLDSHYIPIFYDLQATGILANTKAFLFIIANNVFEVMYKRGLGIRKLEQEELEKAYNEPDVYNRFSKWLKQVEGILEKNEKTLLLTFDEFEKLDDAGKHRYLDLEHLFDWFRNIIQHHPSVALLFSGISTFDEMSTDKNSSWSRYFVNVQTLKVSFLKHDEAQQLITEPIVGFPSEQVFTAEAVKEIIRVTNRHPFLIQAICSEIIDTLNFEKREGANTDDVSTAVKKVLDHWWSGYFRDQWERTNLDQQECLRFIHRLDKATLEDVARESHINEKKVREILRILLKRDLVVHENNNYRISAPIFCEWLELNNC